MKIVVVNRHIVSANRKHGRRDAPLRISNGRYGKPTYTNFLEFEGLGRLVYDPDNPLPCGATIWLEIDDLRKK
jgi:hypothetical protein